MTEFDFSVAEIEISYSHRIAARDRMKVTCSGDVQKACLLFYPPMDHVEYFYVLYLNRNNQILGVHQVSKGGFSGTVVDIRVIFQVALKACACNIICVHNHPSGNLQPSDADVQLTRKIKEAGKVLDIQLLDHLILTTDNGFHSMADNGEV